eukprot:GHVU01062242.1.p1 GENE.GHVU01062242.1~~GHVU01062242.1.p1  ORF type:complete len:280 (-),score=57.27 GHVU01062242.1:211-1050(-)
MPPKFATLDGLRAGAGGSDDDEDEQKLFVGGVGRGGGGSGQNVIDPKKVMEAAQQNGAVSSSQHEEGRSRAFMGSGYSLSGDSSAPVERNEDEKKIRHTITMWSNGFTVDDGPLRRTDDSAPPEDRAFWDDINKGKVPAEFGGGANDQYFSLIDKSKQAYEAPPAASRAFAGAGHSLGGSVVSASAAAAGPVQAPTATVSVDESAPTTTIQLRLHDGTRLTQRFNLTHTVGDIYALVASASPGVEFDLNMSFPRKKLEDKSQTVEAAQLQNAALTQSLK